MHEDKGGADEFKLFGAAHLPAMLWLPPLQWNRLVVAEAVEVGLLKSSESWRDIRHACKL